MPFKAWAAGRIYRQGDVSRLTQQHAYRHVSDRFRCRHDRKRDRDSLEVTVASVLFELPGSRRLAFWRIVGHDGTRRLATPASGRRDR